MCKAFANFSTGDIKPCINGKYATAKPKTIHMDHNAILKGLSPKTAGNVEDPHPSPAGESPQKG